MTPSVVYPVGNVNVGVAGFPVDVKAGFVPHVRISLPDVVGGVTGELSERVGHPLIAAGEVEGTVWIKKAAAATIPIKDATAMIAITIVRVL